MASPRKGSFVPERSSSTLIGTWWRDKVLGLLPVDTPDIAHFDFTTSPNGLSIFLCSWNIFDNGRNSPVGLGVYDRESSARWSSPYYGSRTSDAIGTTCGAFLVIHRLPTLRASELPKADEVTDFAVAGLLFTTSLFSPFMLDFSVATSGALMVSPIAWNNLSWQK